MNLFAEETQTKLTTLGFQNDWAYILSNELDTEKFNDILKNIEKARRTATIYPEDDEIFKLFKLVKYNDIRVVIIGQDPYHNGNANGIAFACKIESSPSLKQIGRAIAANGYGHNQNRTKSLEYLLKQGVFPYNTILTVAKGEPLSHKESIGWNHFTACVIDALNQKTDLIWLLWGAEAQGYGKFINTNHVVLNAEHPAAAARGNREWRCSHFADVNRYLESKDLTKIEW